MRNYTLNPFMTQLAHLPPLFVTQLRLLLESLVLLAGFTQQLYSLFPSILVLEKKNNKILKQKDNNHWYSDNHIETYEITSVCEN